MKSIALKGVFDMKYVAFSVLLALTLSLGCGGGGTVTTGPQTVLLAYQPAGGQYSQYKMTSSVTVNMQGTTNSWVSDIAYSARVESIATDGSVIRRVNFDNFSIFEQSGGKLEPDNAAAGYKGQYLWLRLGPAGEVQEWKGLDGIHSYTSEDRDLKNVLVQQMATIFQPLPKEPLGVGGKWNTSVEIPVTIRGGDFKQKITTIYEVVGYGKRMGRDCVKIQTKSVIEGEGTGLRGADKKFWVDSKGAGKGTIWFDYTNGLLVEYSVGATADQTLSYERAGKADVATEASTIDSETTIKLAK